jgi:hypothetical protein
LVKCFASVDSRFDQPRISGGHTVKKICDSREKIEVVNTLGKGPNNLVKAAFSYNPQDFHKLEKLATICGRALLEWLKVPGIREF